MTLVVAALLGCLATAAHAQQAFTDVYTFTRTMGACLGEENYFTVLRQSELARQRCMGRNPQRDNTNVITPGLRPNNNVGGAVFGGGHGGFPSTFRPTTFHPGFVPNVVLPGSFATIGRKRRQVGLTPALTAEGLADAVAKAQGIVGNFTCVLRETGTIDDNLDLQLSGVIRSYRQSRLDRQLTEDIIQGINACKQQAECLPVDGIISTIPAKVQRLMFFTTCEKEARITACFKQDIRQNIRQFDTRALPNNGGRTSVVDQLTAIIGVINSEQELTVV